MRACVIFNPAAKGDKARRFLNHLDDVASQCVVMPTTCAGDARRLACQAVGEGFDTVIAAGGDGTVNEVLNGITDSPGGFDQARLAVLPLGTVNVFARELGIPLRADRAWKVIVANRETLIDLPRADFFHRGEGVRRYFAQLAGAGLDALAVEKVNWALKKRVGPLAYVWAGLQALHSEPSRMTIRTGDRTITGGLVLVGNGGFYGGSYRVFPEADLRDGQLEVRVFPKVDWLTLARCGPQVLMLGTLPESRAISMRGERVEVTSEDRTPVELDGELAGVLPVTFSVEPGRLRVLSP